MRRKAGTLLPIEVSILSAGLNLFRSGQTEFHGYAIAREIREAEAAKRLSAQGTLYRALDRLEQDGLLESRLEDADTAANEGRPRRRLYHVTAQGEVALSRASIAPAPSQRSLRPGQVTS